MNNIPQDKDTLLSHTRFAVLIALLISNTLFAMGLAPLYMRSISDIGFGFNYLPDILDALILLNHLASFFFAYAAIAYLILNLSIRKAISTMLIFALMTVYKYGLNLVAGWLIYDGIPTTNAEIRLSLISVISNTALEILQHGIIIIAIALIIYHFKPVYDLKRKAKAKLNEPFDMRECVFPFRSLLDKRNPLILSSLVSAAIMTFIQIGQLLIHDIFVGGAPSSISDALWMVTYYVGTFILGGIGYMFMILVLTKFDSHDLKLRQKHIKED